VPGGVYTRYLNLDGNDNLTCVPMSQDFIDSLYSYDGPDPCSLCPAGTYSTLQGATTCQNCPAGKYTDSAGYTGNPLFNTMRQNFLTLIPGSPPKLASPSTRNAAALGSTVLPAYNAQGGPLGQGHVSFDRTNSQYLDGGARTFNIASNGGFTVVAVVRFRGSPGYWERIIDFGNGRDDNILVARGDTTPNLFFSLREGGTEVCVVGSSYHTNIGNSVIVQDQWMAIVARYRSQDRTCALVVNGQLAVSMTGGTVTDKTISKTWVGRSHWDQARWGDNYFNGDIAGLYVTDEYASDEKCTLIADALKEGLDLTEPPACNNCEAGKYINATGATACLQCATNATSTADGRSCACLPGFEGDGQAHCSACVAGKARAGISTDGSACTACVAGKYTNMSAAVLCEGCTVGKYVNATGATACSQCVAKSSSKVGAIACVCEPGFEGGGNVACTACEAGKASGLRCPDGWTNLESTCFGFYSTSLDWASARQRCVDLGGDLAYPANQAQQDLLWSMAGVSAWIGVDDRTSEGSWRTAGGQAISYSSWCPGQSDDGGSAEDCGHLGFQSSGCWNDLLCTASIPYLCQKPEVFDPACAPCQTGSYSNVSAAVRCASCVAGKYINATGATVCLQCATNATSTADGRSCACLPGFEGDGRVHCSACAAGKARAGISTDGSACTACVAGKYTDSAGYTGNPLFNTMRQNFLTLIPGSPPKLASPSTRNAAALGSTVLPAYNAQGGPLGQGHVSFDRTNSQYLDGGARTFNIASNGGFTVVAVVRFRGSPGYWERIIDFGNGRDDNILVARGDTTPNLFFSLREGGTEVCVVGSSYHTNIGNSVIVQDQWMAIVARYRSQDRTCALVVNGQLAVSMTGGTVTDKTISKTWVGRSHWDQARWGDNYFNGDIAGLYVTDEYASDEKCTLIADALKEGLDLTEPPACNNCEAGKYINATGATACLQCATNATSTADGRSCACLPGFEGDGQAHCSACAAGKFSGAQVIDTTNPPETSRTYSSVWVHDGIGTGHSQSMLDSPQAWSAGANAAGQWMKIDLGLAMRVNGVVIQARGFYDNQYVNQYVTEVEVQHSLDPISGFSALQSQANGVRFFPTSTSSNPVKSELKSIEPVVARYIKIVVWSWNGHISMRAGVLTSPGVVSTACTSCPAGKYSAAGASVCATCVAGKTSAAGSHMCVDDENEDDENEDDENEETVVPTPPDIEDTLMEAAQKYPNCQCTLSWQEIRRSNPRTRTGGLGEFLVEGKYEVWVCLQDNVCSTLEDWFCYVFNEQTFIFEAWGLNSELKVVKSK
jgi:hypothetical protein